MSTNDKLILLCVIMSDVCIAIDVVFSKLFLLYKNRICTSMLPKVQFGSVNKIMGMRGVFVFGVWEKQFSL